VLGTLGQSGAGHAPDNEVHPHEEACRDDEQEHETAGPETGEVVQRAEGDGKHEASETADHSNEASDSADAVRVVGSDVLVHGRLAEAHEEAEHEGGDDEGPDADLEM